jgi:hypothetical protein
MPVPKPVREYHVFVDRIVVHRVAMLVKAECAGEASRLVVRELDAEKVDLPSEAWTHVRTEYQTPFIHRAEEAVYPLVEKKPPMMITN